MEAVVQGYYKIIMLQDKKSCHTIKKSCEIKKSCHKIRKKIIPQDEERMVP